MTATESDATAEYTETIHAHGHEHVQATHESTFEITSDDWLTPAGDCILAIDADRVPADFDDKFVAAAQNADAEITATIATDDHSHTITGRGDPDLTFDGDRSAVGRTSEYVDDRTIMVDADAAAADIDRELVAALAEGAEATLTLRVTEHE
ncbi:DUF371 domain-containing protein [Halonotius terrestris]|uniref:DUF371 domain-containing protein n=1 Tax=Halonotius terrestris TaxID=2487750 RepID=A0A8J8PBC0_9EURY|nr:DUF371 domain-containing protein [Halonotius terrestris]TQQ83403.1 DUF371 domain-containing protein [Halonotius terrestris]